MLFSDLALARRLEIDDALSAADHARTLAQLRPESGARAEPVGGGYAVFTGTDSPINRAVGLGMTAPVRDADLGLVEDFFRRAGVAAQVDLCPLADGSLLELLGRRGYRVLKFYNVYVRPLAPGDALPPPMAGITVASVGPEDAKLWSLTAAQGFVGQDDVAPDDLSLEIAATTFHRPGVTRFLARVEGEAAGAGALSVREGLGALFSASTRPAFRQRGVQMALIQARLAAATSAGCDLATVKSVPGSDSQRNIERAGFRLAYTKVTLVQEWAP